MTWTTIPAKGPGLRSTPMPAVVRVDKRPGVIILDLTGLPIDQSARGAAHLASLPGWAWPPTDLTATVLDEPTGIAPQLITVRAGQVWWLGQWLDGRLVVNRPPTLSGGLSYPTEEQK